MSIESPRFPSPLSLFSPLGLLVLATLALPTLACTDDDPGTEEQTTETGDPTGDGDGDMSGDGDGDPATGDGDGDMTGDGDGDETGDGDGDPGDGLIELPTPPELVSEGGSLVGEIEVLFADNVLYTNNVGAGTVDELAIYTRTYNGSIPGPTLRLQQGDIVDLDFVNSLPENIDADTPIANPNWPHRINSTNFHLHGFHADPTGTGDNVLRRILPGVTDAIALDVPANHNPGSHWYHGHKHGSLAVQFYSGMSGMIIIEGDIDEVPEVAAAEEKLIIIQELGLTNQGEVPELDYNAPDFPGLFPGLQSYFAVNGVINPVIRMQPGEVQRWRMLNSTIATIANIELDNHQLHEIAHDGITLEAVNTVNASQMAPGDRVDVMVQAGAPGTYELVSPMGMGPMMMETVLATIIVEGDEMQMDLPQGALPVPDYILPDATGETPDDVRNISFEDGGGPGLFTISGLSYDPSCYNYVLQKDDVVDWVITNNTPAAHPFHIHTNAYQVIEVNGVPQNPARWEDVSLIAGMGGTLRARMRLDDFVGGLLLHCHITSHEELGMMHRVVIVDDTIPDNEKVPADQVDMSDPADINPSIPGYYVSENFTVCQ